MSPARRMLVVAAIASALAALAIPTIDRPIARWVFEHDLASGVWDRGISILEYAGGIEPWRWGGICVICAGVVLTVVMAARVAVDAHFVSDVVAGLALCALVTWACAPVLRTSPPASPR